MFFYQRWLNRIINNKEGRYWAHTHTYSYTAQMRECVHESNHKKMAHGRKVLDDGKMKGIN